MKNWSGLGGIMHTVWKNKIRVTHHFSISPVFNSSNHCSISFFKLCVWDEKSHVCTMVPGCPVPLLPAFSFCSLVSMCTVNNEWLREQDTQSPLRSMLLRGSAARNVWKEGRRKLSFISRVDWGQHLCIGFISVTWLKKACLGYFWTSISWQKDQRE